jgi:uncharacterized integral membrane protein
MNGAAMGFAALFFGRSESMNVLLWCCRGVIFLFLLAFALKNTDPVSVFFLFDTSWQAPLIIVALAFFVGGVVLGLLALLGTIFGLRREISRLKREVKASGARSSSGGGGHDAKEEIAEIPYI